MTPIVNPEILARLIDELEEKFQRLTHLQHDYESRVGQCAQQRERIMAQIQHLQAIRSTYAKLEQADRCLSAPAPAQDAQGEEIVYLGATPEESLRGGGSVEPTF